jgi:hypothetical protein
MNGRGEVLHSQTLATHRRCHSQFDAPVTIWIRGGQAPHKDLLVAKVKISLAASAREELVADLLEL